MFSFKSRTNPLQIRNSPPRKRIESGAELVMYFPQILQGIYSFNSFHKTVITEYENTLSVSQILFVVQNCLLNVKYRSH
jgi:hypothetical protein